MPVTQAKSSRRNERNTAADVGLEGESVRGRRKPKTSTRKRKNSTDSNLPTMGLAGIFLLGVLCLLVMGTVISYDHNQLYMYSLLDANEMLPVIEYKLPEDKSLIMKDKNDTSHLPDFLKSFNNGPRVVEYYAPWCPHCRSFAPHYVSTARQVTAAAAKMGQHVDFYAVSCVASNPICKNQGVTGYPSIHTYPAGSVNASSILDGWEVHPFILLSSLGIVVDDVDRMGMGKKLEQTADTIKSVKKEELGPKHIRTKPELYQDALLSFDFALRHGIFVEAPTLTNKTKDAFREWLQLLRQALPPGFKAHQTLKALLSDFETVVKNEKLFLDKIQPYRPENQEWSYACSHEDGLPGYTCGLWELFHIMTVGVAEWNSLAENKWAVIAPETAAKTLRNYVAHFFGCQVCQENFLAAFDSCAFDRCNRLKPDTDDPDPKDWEQLSLWLWETHNAVNVRLLHERADREGRIISPQEEEAVQWPSRKECPSCWRNDGTWDEDDMFKFLRIVYWYVYLSFHAMQR
jgi:thiol-disulfide isomerase/thioredoxin